MTDATEDLALTLDEVLAEHVYTLKLSSDAPHTSLVDGDLTIPDVTADIIEGSTFSWLGTATHPRERRTLARKVDDQ